MDADLSAIVARLTALIDEAFIPDYSGIDPETADDIRAVLAALDEAQVAEPATIRAFVERVCARAEADMLGGSPLEGAHYRAMQEELRLTEANANGEAQEEA